jgi:hypothetical protein
VHRWPKRSDATISTATPIRPATAVSHVAASQLSAARRRDSRMRAISGSANAARPKITPQPATGMPLDACTADANGESQTSAQCPPPPRQTTSPPRRATTSSYHWNAAHATLASPIAAARPSQRARAFSAVTRSSPRTR